MKKLYLIITLLSGFTFLQAQNNVGIGTTSPNTNALLELQNNSNPLGLLLPRQDIATFTLGAADAGLMVYNPGDNKVYTWNGSAWVSSTSEWGVNGTNIFNLNSGNVGIGTTTPLAELSVNAVQNLMLQLDGSSTVGTWLSLNNSSAGGQWFHIINTGSANGEGAGKLLFHRGTNAGTASGIIMTMDHATANVGIGTSSPVNKLDVTGGMAIGTSFAGVSTAPVNGLIVEGVIAGGIASPSPLRQMHIHSSGTFSLGKFTTAASGTGTNDGVNFGYVDAFGGILMVSENAGFRIGNNNTYHSEISAAGNWGLGTTTPVNRLDVEGGAVIGATYSGLNTAPANGLLVEGSVGIGTTAPLDKVHIFDATDPTIRLTSSATTAFSNAVNSGTIELLEASGTIGSNALGGGITYDGSANLLKLQTYNSATVNDAVLISRNTGNVGIKTTGTPGAELDVNGSVRVQNEVNRPSTGAANLVPICYGNVSATGVIESGSGNFSVAKGGVGRYDITITGESYFFSNYIAIVTPIGSTGQAAGTSSVGGNLLVYLRSNAGAAVDTRFQFVVFKP